MGKLLIIIGIPIILVGLLIVALHSASSHSTKNSSTSQNNSGTYRSNPLIDGSEIQRVRQNLPSATTQPSYHFQYKLAPQVQEKSSSSLPFHISYAYASDCNSLSAASTLPVYVVANHLTTDDAIGIAKSFALTTKPASLPSDDGSSFQYYFSDHSIDAYLSLSQASGTYMFHQALQANEEASKSAATLDQAKATALQAVKDHQLFANTTLKTATYDTTAQQYTITFEKTYAGLPIIDASQLALNTQQVNVCTLKQSSLMGYVNVLLDKEGTITKIENNTRQVISGKTLPRESVDDALTEYQSNPIVVIGGAKTSGTVTISDVLLAYYDYGSNYGQKMYIPTYITYGTVGTDHVITVFPAIAEVELQTIPAYNNPPMARSLQLDTFTLPPPPAPTIVSPDIMGGSGCFGGQVDYTVQCIDPGGIQLCNQAVSIRLQDGGDPLNACTSGCQSKTFYLNSQSYNLNPQLGLPTQLGVGEACNAAMQQLINSQGSPAPSGNTNGQSGQARCVVSGCPC